MDRGTRQRPLRLLPSGPDRVGGVPLHGARNPDSTLACANSAIAVRERASRGELRQFVIVSSGALYLRELPPEGRLGRPSTSFQKRQREMQKREKRKAKEEKKETRRAGEPAGAPIEMMNPADLGLPELDSISSEEHQVPEDIQAAIGVLREAEEEKLVE